MEHTTETTNTTGSTAEALVALPVGKAKRERKAKAAAQPKPAPVAKAKTEKAKHECACGCGEMVSRYFRQGHDQRVRGILQRSTYDDNTTGNLPPALVAAIQRGLVLNVHGEDVKPNCHLLVPKASRQEREALAVA